MTTALEALALQPLPLVAAIMALDATVVTLIEAVAVGAELSPPLETAVVSPMAVQLAATQDFTILHSSMIHAG
ncbi:MAG: hypothetical protein M1399_01450 [Actinobacteria bacterium]|nr:hypothetical protein [Actinomycetota bacterium]MCL5445852.1 hypothetical protein [Actinomycetota bacterium]